MSYKITITRIDKDVPYKDREYQQTGVDAEGEKTYDYVYSDAVHDVNTQVFEQTVDELNLKAVIATVNGLDSK
jgi:hypothetical protein